MLILILLNSIVGLCSYLLTSYFFVCDSIVDRIISFFVLFISQIIFSEQILGIMGILKLNFVILFNLCLLMIIFFSISFFKIKPVLPFNKQLQFAISNLKLNKLELFCLTALIAFMLSKILINLINPPFGWDDLNYHFTFPVEWLKNGNLDNPLVINDDPSPSYYPLNGSLIFFWLMAPLRNFLLADLGQVPFFIISYLAVYSIARKIKLSKEAAFYGATLFALIPNFFKQLEIAYVDIMVAALFLIALNSLLVLRQRLSFSNLILFSLSLGLMIGTKSLAAIYAVFLILPLLLVLAKNFKATGGVVLTKYILLLGLLFICFGGFSYIRNLVLTGNPFYPMDVQMFGKLIFKGAIDRLNYSAHFMAGDYSLAKLLFHEGLGVQTILFVLPGMFLALPLYLLKTKEKTYFQAYVFTLPILLYFVFRYLIPLGNVRYMYNLLALGTILGFYVYHKIKIPLTLEKFLIGICVLASLSELSRRRELLIALIFWWLLFILFAFIPNSKKIFFQSLPIIMLLLIVILQKDYVDNEYSRYITNSRFWPDATKAWKWVNENTSGNNISYVGRPVPLPLYGTNFKNRVFYTSVNKVNPAKLHYFKEARLIWSYGFEQTHKNLEEKNNYRGKADYASWLNNLVWYKADLLFVYSLHQTKKIEFPLEDNWAQAHPEKFKSVFTNESVHIYRII